MNYCTEQDLKLCVKPELFEEFKELLAAEAEQLIRMACPSDMLLPIPSSYPAAKLQYDIHREWIK